MTNQSIYNAFERMWQHILLKFSTFKEEEVPSITIKTWTSSDIT